MDSFDVI